MSQIKLNEDGKRIIDLIFCFKLFILSSAGRMSCERAHTRAWAPNTRTRFIADAARARIEEQHEQKFIQNKIVNLIFLGPRLDLFELR